MTTLKQVKNLVVPLLARHPELALVGRAIVFRPIGHLVHVITVDRTGEAARFRPFWGVFSLFAKNEEWSLGLGEQIYGGPPLWEWSFPDLPEIFAETVERVALPKLHAIQSLRDFLAFSVPTDEYRKAYRPLQVRLLFALGDLDEAREILVSDEKAAWWLPHLERIGIKDRLMKLGNRLSHADRVRLAGLFHEWEAESVRNLKIEHLWERTPFPLEERAPGE